jgi:ATPase subunit of ABC transporter with duplicated ATPase domains
LSPHQATWHNRHQVPCQTLGPGTLPFAIVCTDLSFAWPDGKPVLTGLNAAFNPGRTGLIGPNRAGKSTLLKLIAGELSARRGTITVNGDIGYLPQDVTLDTEATVSDLLNITTTRNAIAAIEDGDASQEHFDAITDDWDIEGRARAQLDTLGLAHVDLDAPAERLSGGETILTALSAHFLRRRSYCCSTSRRTTWTSRLCGSSHRPCHAMRER